MASLKPIVIKIGTSSLTSRKAGEAINYEVINKLAHAIHQVQTGEHLHSKYGDGGAHPGHKVILVSSGAMGLGVSKLGLRDANSPGLSSAELLTFKQALTGVGQIELMKAYESVFKHYGCHVAQVLVTHAGLHDERRHSTLQKTLSKLFELNVLPVVNENDTVAPEELEFGDNDRLAAWIAVLAAAEKLIILTDCEGLYDADPHSNPNAQLIHTVTEIDQGIRAIAGDSSTDMGLGGMRSKIMAAEICLQGNVAMRIMSTSKIDKIPEIISHLSTPGKYKLGTEFLLAK